MITRASQAAELLQDLLDKFVQLRNHPDFDKKLKAAVHIQEVKMRKTLNLALQESKQDGQISEELSKLIAATKLSGDKLMTLIKTG